MVEDKMDDELSLGISTATLLSRIRSGDEAAFEELLVRYSPLISAEAMQFSDGEKFSVEEARADAIEAFHAAAKSYSPDRGTTFGLYAKICIARALIKEKAKSGSYQPELPDPDAVATGSFVEKRLLADESVKEFHRRVRNIASDYEYRVFCLYLGNVSAEETARRLGKPVRSVENARERLFVKIRQNADLFRDLY